MQSASDLLASTYSSFNARDIDSVLKNMHPDVDWPNGMEGGRVHGHREVRDYWTRQWALVDPHVQPMRFLTGDDGRTTVEVHQVVRDLSGNVLLDRTVHHIYSIRDGLIESMEIHDPDPV